MNIQRSSSGARSFTLVEIMITLVITGVMATIAIPAYQNFIEDGKSRMCEENLEGLDRELQVYMVEHGVVPGDLGQLPREHIERALARANARVGWKVKLALFLDEQMERGVAYADIVGGLARGNLAMLICPSDPRKGQAGVSSYGINSILIGMDKDTYTKLSDQIVLIADSLTPTFSGNPDLGALRHKRVGGLFSGFTSTKYANGIRKNGKVKKIKSYHSSSHH